MASIGIVTDSTADLPAGFLDGYPVAMVPLLVNWDGQSFRDKVDLSTAEFYRRLRTSKSLPRTGAPSLAAFEALYRQELEKHDALVEISLASRLSATYEVARNAAANVDPKRITVVDSGTVSICLAWLVEIGARLAHAGADVATIVERLEETRSRVRILVLVESLDFLQRGGRIGRAQALAGTLLSVKPILSIRDGDVAPVERVRTLQGALRRLVELTAAIGPLDRLGVVDGDASASAVEVERQLRLSVAAPNQPIDRGELGPVLGVHGGPGVVGVGVLLAG